nr:MAG TPA: hypothetical protein [Caudoviricetes sp.]
MPARRVPRARAGARRLRLGPRGPPGPRAPHGGALGGQEASKERKVSPTPPLKREIYNN